MKCYINNVEYSISTNPKFYDYDTVSSNPSKIANLFAFHCVYVTDRIQKLNVVSTVFNTSNTCLGSIYVNITEVYDGLVGIDMSKGPGPDGLILLLHTDTLRVCKPLGIHCINPFNSS